MKGKLIGLLALLFLLPGLSDAYICVPPAGYSRMSEEEQLLWSRNHSTSVFAGRVSSNCVEDDTQITEFEVLRVWKGNVPAVAVLRESMIFDSQGAFAVGAAYLVFARSDQNGLYLHSCLPLISLYERDGKVVLPPILGRGRRPDV